MRAADAGVLRRRQVTAEVLPRGPARVPSVLSISACSKPEAPDKEQPPEPQVTAEPDATQLRDAIQEPIDKARAAEKAVQDAADAQRAAVEAAGG